MNLDSKNDKEQILHGAIMNENADQRYKIVELLLQRGASPNIQDKDGKTPLYHAAEKDHRNTVVLLLLWGADTTIVDKNGCTGLDYIHDKTVVESLRNCNWAEMRSAGHTTWAEPRLSTKDP